MTKLPLITPKLLREWGACKSDSEISALLKARKVKAATPTMIATATELSLNDRLWVLGRYIWMVDETAARMCAIESAATVTHLAGDDDDQAIHAGLLNDLIQIEEELPAAARDAARDAALDAAWDAARDAAWDAARDAAWDAARDAARDAAWDAARDAAWDAALDAARGAAWDAARDAAWDAALQDAINRIMDWLDL